MFKKALEERKLNSYQLIQYKHDVNYHPDILSLGVVGRMKHIVLHLMKYRAKLSSYGKNEEQNTTALVDSFIMLVSSSNALGIKISEENICYSNDEYAANDFLEDYLQILGKMAKATESADHQEDYSINRNWKKCIKELLCLVISESYHREIDVIEKSIVRLKSVEENHKLYFMLKEIV